MKQHQMKNKTGLMPHIFKKIGIVVMLASVIPAIIVKVFHAELSTGQSELLKIVTMNIFILGLLFIACARDKTEDEMTIALRLKSMAFTFMWAVFLVIILPFTDFIFGLPPGKESAHQLVMSMLFFYILLYYYQKKRR